MTLKPELCFDLVQVDVGKYFKVFVVCTAIKHQVVFLVLGIERHKSLLSCFGYTAFLLRFGPLK